jgi:hypothetical protein
VWLAERQVRPLQQIVPTAMNEMMKDEDEKRLARVTEAFLKMKKFAIARLKEAYEQLRNVSFIRSVLLSESYQ